MTQMRMTEDEARQEIVELIEDWGRVFPGMNFDLALSAIVRSNLRLIVSTFGIVAHTYQSGEMGFRKPEHIFDIHTTLSSLIKLITSVGISSDEWDQAIEEIQSSAKDVVLPVPAKEVYDA